MIKPRPYQAGETSDANDQKTFVFTLGLLVFGFFGGREVRAAAIEIRLKHIGSHQQTYGDHQSEGRNGQADPDAEMES